MDFYMPVKVHLEKNAVKGHADEIARLGSKALIVTGRGSSARNGSLSDVTDALESVGIPYEIFNEVEANPSVATVMKAREIGIQTACDMVIGVGGGSALDASKVVSLMMYHKDADQSFLFDKNAPDTAYPVIAVPTTCGTGSEVTAVSILTLHEQKTKSSTPHKIFPDLALIDGKYLLGAPMQLIRNTAVDALGHLIESYINLRAGGYSRMITDRGLSTWSRIKDVLLGRRSLDEESAELLMSASCLGGMSIAHTGTTIPHGLSYGITYALGMPHGKAIGYFQAGYLKEASEEDRGHILELTGFTSVDELQSFYEEVCGSEKLDRATLETAVEMILARPEKLSSVPFDTDKEVLERIAGIR